MAAESPSIQSAPAAPPGLRRGNGSARAQPVFLFALLAGLALHVAGLALFHVDLKRAVPAHRPPAFINYPREDEAAMLRDDAMIKDPEPIYLLTTYNYASPEIIKGPPSPVARPQAAFGPYPAALNLAEKDFRPATHSGTEPAQPAEILSLGQAELFKASGQAPLGGTPLPPRDAHLQVVPMTAGADNNSAPAASVALAEDWPVTGDFAKMAGDSQWKPVSFLLIFDPGGLTAQPVQLRNSFGNSSGNPDVDKNLRDRLNQEFSHHPLPAGTYEALLGP